MKKVGEGIKYYHFWLQRSTWEVCFWNKLSSTTQLTIPSEINIKVQLVLYNLAPF